MSKAATKKVTKKAVKSPAKKRAPLAAKFVVGAKEPKFHEESIRSTVYAKVKSAGAHGLSRETALKVEGASAALPYLVKRGFVKAHA